MMRKVGALLLLASAAEAFNVGVPPLARQQRIVIARGRAGVLNTQAKLGAIIFGCDGVLIDSEKDGHRVALNQAIAEVKPGLECTVEAYGKLRLVRGEQRLMAVWKEMGWEGMTMELAENIYKRKAQIFTEMLESNKIPLRPGVAELVDAAIAAGVKVVVCSSNSQKNVELVVNSMGMVRSSNIEIFAGARVSNRKPSPDIYNLAKGTLGCDAADVLVIEDDKVGLEAASAAKMACLITTTHYTQGEDFGQADRVLDSLRDVGLEEIMSLPRSMVGLNA